MREQIDRRGRGEYRGEYKMPRERSHEPAEQRRAQRRASGACELCERPTNGTVRCRQCAQRIEGNTERYRGAGRRGPPERIASDLVDLGYAIAELDKARRGFASVEQAGETNRRRRTLLLIEPRSAAELARRFVDAVLARNPPPADTTVLEPFTAPIGDHTCTRCQRPALEDGDLCDRHYADQLARLRKANAKRRDGNRANGKCADCGSLSARYRCDRCAKRGEYSGEYKAAQSGAAVLAAGVLAKRPGI